MTKTYYILQSLRGSYLKRGLTHDEVNWTANVGMAQHYRTTDEAQVDAGIIAGVHGFKLFVKKVTIIIEDA